MQKNIAAIYDEYRIPPWLALHMYRVAAVAAAVFDARADGSEAERNNLISACLLHDMGNIIKFDFTTPLFGIEEGEYWKNVRKEMIEKYGSDEHHATLEILLALGVSPRVYEIVDSVGFGKNEATSLSGDILKKIAAYADSRVVPNGVGSIADRLNDMHERYAKKHPANTPETERNAKALYDIERELFTSTLIKPEDITETSIASVREKLSRFDIICQLG